MTPRSESSGTLETWYVLPSANASLASRTLPSWRRFGYKIAVLIDETRDLSFYAANADVVIFGLLYKGYPWAIRYLVELKQLKNASIIIAGADDLWPASVECTTLSRQFFERFPDGFGVMQPTGDGHGCENICGSPWMGRAFVRRINGGMGPFWPDYNHYFCDLEMKKVSEVLGILWQRPDIAQQHDHWTWVSGIRPVYMIRHAARHAEDQLLYLGRLQAGFPGSAPLRPL